MAKVLPSLLSANFLTLNDDIRSMEQSGADIFHLDVMDGQFVPNISYGIPVIEQIARAASIPLDVHLMTEDPEQFLETFAEIGVSMLSFHVEATHHAHRMVQQIQSLKMKAGIALNPHTPITAVKHLLNDVDFVLIMTVNPGFGGQSFIDSTLSKLDELKQYRDDHKLHFLIEVDGGINEETAKWCTERGADLLVSGSFLFQSDDRQLTIERLKRG